MTTNNRQSKTGKQIELAILLFTLYCLLFISAPIGASAHGGTNDENNIIRISKDGFEPKELTVIEGDEVLFINNDDVAHWPASNFHPTHTLYSEFDPLKGIPPGESWKFKFEKVGAWRMHDHLSPHLTGTIVVLKDTTIQNSTPETATSTQGASTGFWSKIKSFLTNLWYKLFSQNKKSDKVNSTLLGEFKKLDERDKYERLKEVAENDSPETAWQLVRTTYNTPEGVVGNPHDMAHLVGQFIYKAYGFKGLSICEPIFAFGCYHGLMEVAFDKDRGNETSYGKDLLSAQEGCKTVGDLESPTYWSCIHGMGHGVATFRDHNIDKSLKDCDLLNERVRTYCHDGVFMEFSISAPQNFYKKSDPIYPCDAIEESYKIACARAQVQVMRLRFQMNTSSIALTCIKTENKNIIFHCIDALGYFIAQTAGGSASTIINGCQVIQDKKAAGQCLAAAAGELVFQDYAGWRDSVTMICQSLTGADRDYCTSRVEQVKKSYGRN